ncbi:MAG TPA: hypothetical protein VGC89_17590, partial [Pyrinomonadaceae bacterium]
RPQRELEPPISRSSIEEIRRETEKAVEVIRSENKTEAEISSFIADFDSFTKRLAGKLMATGKPLEGANQAQEFLDAHKVEMKAKFAAVTCIPSSKVSRRFQQEMGTHFFNDGVLIGRLLVIYGSDASVKALFAKLSKDFLELLQTEAPCPAQTIAAL